MRDNRANIENLKREIREEIESVKRNFRNIEKFTKYIEDKLYGDDPVEKRRNLGLIDSNCDSVITSTLYIINSKYTLGCDLSELHKEYLVILDQIDKINSNCGSTDSNIFALGILFEDGIEKFQKLIDIMDDYREHNLLSDYFINSCGLKRKHYSKIHISELKFLGELIELAQKDREQASKKLVHYFKTNWNEPLPTKEACYVRWLWKYAAIAKIFKLDDSKLKDQPHYPYDLVHYKNEMRFFPEKMLDFPKEYYEKGIPYDTRLEKLIPVKFHKYVNELFMDFKNMDDEEFWEKYEVCEWLDLEEYIEQKNEPEMFGTLLIHLLVDNFYVFVFDKLDDLDSIDSYKSFWGKRKVRPVCFDLGNFSSDCYYIAYVPKSMKLKSILGVKIRDAKEYKELDQYSEYIGQFDYE